MSSMDGQSKGRSRLAKIGLYAALAVAGAGAGAITAGLISGGGGLANYDLNRAVESADQANLNSGLLVTLANPQPVPDLGFTDGSGAQHHLSDWQGKVVLVNLWATWCAPCKAEMPSLDRLQARLGNERFAVVAISTDRNGPDQPASFFAKEGIKSLALYNDRTLAATTLLKAPGLPLSVIIDAQGRQVARFLGPANWDRPEATAKIGELLGSGKPPG
jgi:thiol-disulfide isomerase/thioredoxin